MMMLNAEDVRGLEVATVAVYERAEAYLIQVITAAIANVGEAPNWAEAALLETRRMRAKVEGMAKALEARLPELMLDATDQAYVRGRIAAEVELRRLPGVDDPKSSPINNAAVMRLAGVGVDKLHPVHMSLFRNVDDVWRRIVAEASGNAVVGVRSVFQAAQDAHFRMAREGHGFFRDAAGRKWGLDTYAEMAVRTTTNNALRAGHTDAMVANGQDLVIVSSHKNPAPQCAPFERKVLSLTGKYGAGSHRVGDSIVHVKATMRDAEASGLHHPNCKHVTSVYLPGITPLDTPPVDDGHAGYRATQRQRYLEREIRASKRMELAAASDEQKRKATARKRAYQQRLREHVDKHDLPRRRHREQLRTPKDGAARPPSGVTVHSKPTTPKSD